MTRPALPIAACLFVLAGALTAQASDDLTGVYKGTLSVGVDVPATTILVQSDDGAISGTYVYQDQGRPSAGELTDCTMQDLRLNCIWRDSHGAGDFVAFFHPDLGSFDGGWFEDINPSVRTTLEGSNFWDGFRTE